MSHSSPTFRENTKRLLPAGKLASSFTFSEQNLTPLVDAA